jgi:Dolichyl-phosphate-mannose-protein mannosyltransferase
VSDVAGVTDGPATLAADTEAGTPPEAAPRWWSGSRVAMLGALAAGLLALGICIHQLSVPGVLHGIDEYDDGFYLGTVMRLATGTLPYKNFVYPQPPGLPLLLFPLGLFGRIVGTRTLMADIRILTAIVAAVNATLAGYLLRRRGVVPALVAGATLALYPIAVAADKTLMLEPYLVLFCLIGVTVLFKGEELSSGRRLIGAGVILGFACTLKLWALMPVAVALLACLPLWRRRVRPLAIAVIAGFAVPTLPFFLLAPQNFLRDIIAIQFLRHHAPETTSASDRLVAVVGLRGLQGLSQTYTVAFFMAGALVAIILIGYVVPVRRMSFDWFVLGLALVAVGAMFVSPDFHPHYAYFAATFLALLLGVSVDRIARFAGSAIARSMPSRANLGFLAPALAIVLVVGASIWGVTEQNRSLRVNPGLLTLGEMSLPVKALIPAGACTVTDEPALTILADRFVPNRSSCPDVVDTFSTWIAFDPNTLPPSKGPYDTRLAAAWQSWFAAADYVVLSEYPFRIPWTGDLTAWFNRNYRMISPPLSPLAISRGESSVTVYQFVGQRAL